MTRRFRATLHTGVALLLLVPGAVASVRAAEETMLARVQALDLPFLEGTVGVYYSDGFSDRAANLQTVVEQARGYFESAQVLDVSLDLSLAVLDPEDWARVSTRPYGLPHVWALPDEPKMAFMPATGESPIVALNLSLEKRLPASTLETFEEIGTSFGEAVVRFADLILIHELGHAYAFEYLTRFSQRWLNEFLATYLAYSQMTEHSPDDAAIWVAVNDALVAAADRSHTTLEAFDRLYIGVGLENYGWYQGRFQQRAAAVFGSAGLRFVHDFKRAWSAEPEPGPDDPLRLRQLEAVQPGFTEWARGLEGDLERASATTTASREKESDS